MSRRKREPMEVFGLSFMDLISCGLGGVIILMLVFSSLVRAAQGRANAAAQQARSEDPACGMNPASMGAFYILHVRLPDASRESTLTYLPTSSTLGEPDIWSNFQDSFSSHGIHFRLPDPNQDGTHAFRLDLGPLLAPVPVYISLFSNGTSEDTLYTRMPTIEIRIVKTAHGFNMQH